MNQPAPRAAIYARYSTDMQNPNSVRDQIASCRECAKREGWQVVGEYFDEAMSGTRSDRPDFQRLQADLSNQLFDLVLLESLDRLSHSMEDLARFYAIARYHDIRIQPLDGLEADQLRIGINGTFAEMFIENVRVKTHRGLKAQVEAGKSGGGRSYGYDVARGSDDQVIKGELVIIPEEAEIIRRIFRDYANGLSPVKIAAALNAEGVPSPRARAGSGHWKQNTINGNRERGTGILNNELYAGQRIWNRLQYRKDPETSKRVSRLRPRSEWLTQDAPELRIVDQDLWDAVKDRQGRQITAIRKAEAGDRQGLGARGAARRRKHLFSGLLDCGKCGGSLTVAGNGDRKRYYCSNAKEKGPSICTGMPGLLKLQAEDLILSGLREGLMTDSAVAQFRKDYERHLKEQTKGSAQRIATRKAAIRDLEGKRLHFKEAIGQGHINPTILEGLSETEARLAALKAEAEADAGNVVQIPKDIRALYRAHVDALAETLSGGDVIGRASDQLHELIEQIVVTWDEDARAHHLDLTGDIVLLLCAGDNKKSRRTFVGGWFAKIGCGGLNPPKTKAPQGGISPAFRPKTHRQKTV